MNCHSHLRFFSIIFGRKVFIIFQKLCTEFYKLQKNSSIATNWFWQRSDTYTHRQSPVASIYRTPVWAKYASCSYVNGIKKCFTKDFPFFDGLFMYVCFFRIFGSMLSWVSSAAKKHISSTTVGCYSKRLFLCFFRAFRLACISLSSSSLLLLLLRASE